MISLCSGLDFVVLVVNPKDDSTVFCAVFFDEIVGIILFIDRIPNMLQIIFSLSLVRTENLYYLCSYVSTNRRNNFFMRFAFSVP